MNKPVVIRHVTHYNGQMKRGPKPLSGETMTPAERQARYRAAHYQDWLDSLPENLAEGSTAEALQAICELDLSELEGIEPPRGFGRD